MQRQLVYNERSTLKKPGKKTERIASFGSYDVLFGRTRLSFNNFGNMRFRALIADNYHEYHISKSRMEKANVTNKIMAEIHDNGGKFLRFEGNEWCEVPSKVAKRKIGHALRDFSNNPVDQDSTGMNAHIDTRNQSLLEKQNITKDIDSTVNKNPFPVYSSSLQMIKNTYRNSVQDKNIDGPEEKLDSLFPLAKSIQGGNLQIDDTQHSLYPVLAGNSQSLAQLCPITSDSILNENPLENLGRQISFPESFCQETQVTKQTPPSKTETLQAESINMCDEGFIIEDVIPTPKALLEPISDCDMIWHD